MNTIAISINGESYEVPTNATLAFIIEHLSLPHLGCVFAINNQVVPHSEWQTQTLSRGDAISLFQAIAGG
ncbi:sulfur carrier protein ThiS [Vibrio vulnificus]|uniref:sulfur carrier protein ThiS n=1 Tax=Vibrio vulnificus TaxID=672 RepID=UPI0009B62F2C|nr:sulfur carrier protein ThiS [Vibrio vulnificus]MCU8465428.1 sulfur carrier protein ThiS [Vibrio vulnificus]OQK47787.1 sulfur carrier protein ThiS [Vibrio vulnificus]